MKKLVVALAALAAWGTLALAPEASARPFGFYGSGYRMGGFHGRFRPAFGGFRSGSWGGGYRRAYWGGGFRSLHGGWGYRHAYWGGGFRHAYGGWGYRRAFWGGYRPWGGYHYGWRRPSWGWRAAALGFGVGLATGGYYSAYPRPYSYGYRPVVYSFGYTPSYYRYDPFCY